MVIEFLLLLSYHPLPNIHEIKAKDSKDWKMKLENINLAS